jgi:PAS domain S-box-containing protein
MFTKIKYRILVYFIILGIIPLGIILLIEYYNYLDVLRNRSFNQLKTTREIKSREIENYFFNTNREVALLAQSQNVIEAMKAFKKSFHSLNQKKLPDKYVNQLTKYYLTDFRNKVRTPDSNAINFSSLVPTDPASILLQTEYVSKTKTLPGYNPYQSVHEKYHKFFSDFTKISGYYDLLMIDDESGHVIYSVEKEIDFGTNLLNGPHSKSNIAKLYKKVRDSAAKQPMLCDFERYLPSFLAPASFIAMPVYDGTQKIGTLIFQIPIDKLDGITTDKKNWRKEELGETGECYVVGSDCKLRTNSRFIIEKPKEFFKTMERSSYDKSQIELMKYYKTTVLFQTRCSYSVNDVSKDQTGLMITKDYRGIDVMSASALLNIPGVKWFIVAEMDVSEVFASVYAYRLNSFFVVGIVFVILLVVAFFIARSIYNPIKILVYGAKELGKGNLNVQLDIKNKDEFGLLAKAFNTGVNALKNDRTEILESALYKERKLNEELALREEELTSNEEELRQSIESQSKLLDKILIKEANVSALINNTKDLIYSIDMEFRLVEFNTSIYAFLKGRGIEIYKGMDFRDFVYTGNLDKAKASFQNAMLGEPQVVLFDIPIEHVIQSFEGYFNPIVNDLGKILGVSIVIRNISERKKAEDAIKASEEKYAMWFHSNPDLIMVSSIEEGKIIDVNYGFENHSGFKREEIIGKTIAEFNFFVNPNERKKLKKLLMSNKKINNYEAVVKKKSGEEIILLISGEIVKINDEKCLISISRDITKQRNADAQIRQTTERLKAVLDNIPIALWTVDKNGIITLSEGKALALMGLKGGQHVGESVYEAYKGKPEHTDYIKLVLEQGITYRKNEVIGNRFYEEIISPIKDENNEITGLIGISFDITERKLSEERIEQKNNELIEAYKMMADYKLMALRSAMNPHFIFNTLNSIQYFILKNDKLNAVTYISSFAKLIRNTLNNSIKNKIKLSEEIEQIKNYVHLEMMRFELKFDFILDVEEELDIDNSEISPMLVQPYIENAILHGLYNKPEKGILKVSIKEEKEYILIEIEDNGIGREAAAKFKNYSSVNYRSLGTYITEERLKLINDQFGSKPEIHDLYIDEKPAGTKIKIWIN